MATGSENTLPEMNDETRAALATKLVAEMHQQMKIEDAAIAQAHAAGTIDPQYEVRIDQQGHLCAHTDTTRRASLDLMLAESGKDVVTTRINPDTGEDCESLTVAFYADASNACYWCEQRPVFSYDGTLVRAVTPCEFPDGYSVTVSLSVTSGKIVIAEDLSHVYTSSRLPDGIPRKALGRKQTMETVAQDGSVFGFIPKVNFNLYQSDENTFALVSPGCNDDWEPNEVEGTELASLDESWTYAVADHDDYLTKGGTIDDEWMEVVEVPNGIYTFTHHVFEKPFDGNDYSTPMTLASITRTDA